MRRRPPRMVEPPARLRCYVEADWLQLVDLDTDDSQWHGYSSRQGWRRCKAVTLWGDARRDWYLLHGWPGGLDSLDLLREQLAVRRALPRWGEDHA